jgi:hypothetical protein
MLHHLTRTAVGSLSVAIACFTGAAAEPAISHATDLAPVLAGKSTMTVQRVSAKGTLLCGANPSSGSESRVLLINKRIGADDSVRTSPQSDGTFALDLNLDRFYTIEPELWIYTNCAAKTLGIPPGCQRLQKIKIPSSYINSRQPYDLGTRNLATKQPDEEQSC